MDRKTGAFARRTVHINVSCQFLDDAANRGQTQARPVANVLGCEERLENTRPNGFVHTVARIDNLQGDVRSGRGRRIHRTRFPVCPERADRELAAQRHRIPRIRGQIHQHLLQLARVCPHRSGLRC